MDVSNHMHEKGEVPFDLLQKLTSIFEEVIQAFRLRGLLREQIKELKANSIRSRYNSRYEATDKLLNDHKKKYASWTEALLRELSCSIALVRTLVRELSDMYYSLMQQSYGSH